jgi:hypothetical protein
MPRQQIAISSRGCCLWLRYVISDSQRHFWTGTTWSSNPADAKLYHDEAEACQEVDALQQGSVVRIFTTTIRVIVDGGRPYDLTELQDYLLRNLKPWLGGDGGEHVCDSTDITFEIDWGDLIEAENS